MFCLPCSYPRHSDRQQLVMIIQHAAALSACGTHYCATDKYLHISFGNAHKHTQNIHKPYVFDQIAHRIVQIRAHCFVESCMRKRNRIAITHSPINRRAPPLPTIRSLPDGFNRNSHSIICSLYNHSHDKPKRTFWNGLSWRVMKQIRRMLQKMH